MKNPINIFLLFILLSFRSIYAQDTDKNASAYIELGGDIEQVFWPDTLLSHHTYNFPSQVFITDKKLQDNKLYRLVYYPNGSLKVVAEIKSGIIRTDTISLTRPNPPYNWYDTIIEVKGDVCNGSYIQYWPVNHSGENPNFHIRGHYKEGTKVGEWTEYLSDGGKIISHYDDYGNLSGSYTEYYDETTIKWKGQYSIQRIGSWKYVPDAENKQLKKEKTDRLEGIKWGSWQLFNRRGELIQTVDFTLSNN